MAQVAQKLVSSVATKVPQLAQRGVNFAQPKLSTFWKYARVELRPPGAGELPQVQRDIQNMVVAARTGKWKNVTAKEAWRNTLVTMEVAFWFFIGECIGKGSIVGYQIPGATHFDMVI